MTRYATVRRSTVCVQVDGDGGRQELPAGRYEVIAHNEGHSLLILNYTDEDQDDSYAVEVNPADRHIALDAAENTRE